TTNNQHGLTVNVSANPASASARMYTAMTFNMVSSSSNLTNATLAGMYGGTYYYGTGTVGYAMGGYFQNQIDAAGTLTESYNLYVDSPYVGNGGAITRNAGLAIEEQSSGTNNTNLLLGTS